MNQFLGNDFETQQIIQNIIFFFKPTLHCLPSLGRVASKAPLETSCSVIREKSVLHSRSRISSIQWAEEVYLTLADSRHSQVLSTLTHLHLPGNLSPGQRHLYKQLTMTSYLRLDVGQGAAMWLQGEGIARKVTNKVGRIISKLKNTIIREGDSTSLYSTAFTVYTVYTV